LPDITMILRRMRLSWSFSLRSLSSAAAGGGFVCPDEAQEASPQFPH